MEFESMIAGSPEYRQSLSERRSKLQSDLDAIRKGEKLKREYDEGGCGFTGAESWIQRQIQDIDSCEDPVAALCDEIEAWLKYRHNVPMGAKAALLDAFLRSWLDKHRATEKSDDPG